MNYSQNPFQELYVADTVSEKHFVRLFSAVPMLGLAEFHQLFQEGNVVLLGSQGCGKTMLLTLFRPEIREAYAEKGEDFPVPKELRRFLSAGINLTRCGIAHLTGVTLGNGHENDLLELPYFFGDFFNYKLVLDLLENLEKVAANPKVFDLKISLNKEADFIKCLRQQDCWAGAIDDCSTLEDLKQTIQRRLECYRNWMGHNTNQRGVPELLKNSKSTIGEPILRTVSCLKKAGIIEDVPVFIRVDQIEELAHAPPGPSANLRLAFRQMLNTALSRRDKSVTYRLGSRPYGWDSPTGCLDVLGGGALEENRDYIRANFDNAWRRTEQVQGHFEDFAADAFRRRIEFFLNEEIAPDSGLLDSIFSKSAFKRDRIEPIFNGATKTPNSYRRTLAMSEKKEADKWSSEWKLFLSKLYKKKPLEAVLAAAWGRQTGGGKGKPEHRTEPPPTESPYPWESTWWRKERLSIALLQFSARRGQRLLWWGKKDILDLSGGNILAFLGICHGIWNQFLKTEQAKDDGEQKTNPFTGDYIDHKLQAVGIQEASKVWYDKLSEHKPGGDIRQRFISKLGIFLRRSLREDKKMSHPGGNGFSLELDVLENHSPLNRDVYKFLKQCVDWGALVAANHTTKKSSGEPRLKFYLHPLLSPTFQLPVAHTKEPLYWEVEDFIEIAKEAQLPFLFAHPDTKKTKKTKIKKKTAIKPPRERETGGDKNQLNLF